jgi:hypothetical protein
MLGIRILGREWWIPSTTAPIIRAVTSIPDDSDDEPDAPKLHVNLLTMSAFPACHRACDMKIQTYRPRPYYGHRPRPDDGPWKRKHAGRG